jgi:hypothetical protein
MGAMRHLASPIAKSLSGALRFDTEAGSWIFISGQVGVAIPRDNKPITFYRHPLAHSPLICRLAMSDGVCEPSGGVTTRFACQDGGGTSLQERSGGRIRPRVCTR